MAFKAEYHEIWVSAWHAQPPADYYHSIMIHCPIPQYLNDVKSVYISQDVPCDKNGVLLPVQNDTFNEEKKHDFCICVKPLDFPHEPRLAPRLIEWIESNLQLGAQKIVIYIYSSKCINPT